MPEHQRKPPKSNEKKSKPPEHLETFRKTQKKYNVSPSKLPANLVGPALPGDVAPGPVLVPVADLFLVQIVPGSVARLGVIDQVFPTLPKGSQIDVRVVRHSQLSCRGGVQIRDGLRQGPGRLVVGRETFVLH